MLKILLFPEDCASSGLSQDPSDRKASYEILNYFLESTLQFALFKIKIRLLESDQKCLRHVSSTEPLLLLCKEITPRKHFWGIINLLRDTGDLDKNNDVNHNIFRCLIPLI